MEALCKKITPALLWLILCLSVGAISSLFTAPAIQSWYSALAKPAFNPPNWLFAPAWTLLYLLIGMAAYLVWAKGNERKEVRGALYLFLIQLALNFLWSLVFFHWHALWWAFAEIVVLWLVILCTILKFRPISRFAMYLMVPYILWVSFAAILNLSVAILNK